MGGMFWGKVIEVLALVAGFLGVLQSNAHAYLDPGTGSYVVQVVIATLAGGAFLVVAFWGRIKSFLGKLISRFLGKRQDGNQEE